MMRLLSLPMLLLLFCCLAPRAGAVRSVGVPQILQDEPIRVTNRVTVVGTTYEYASNMESVSIRVPDGTREGDLMVIYIGGSSSGIKRPSDPSGAGWETIIDIGPADLNLKAFYKWHLANDDGIYSVPNGKNTFVSLLTLRGVDKTSPIVDSNATKDSMPGSNGAAVAPSVYGEQGGAVIGTFVYDDPHVGTITSNGFQMLLSSDTATGDGMAAGVAPCLGGETGSIHVIGLRDHIGAGDDIGMAISFRPRPRKTKTPTLEPTQNPAQTLMKKPAQELMPKPTLRATQPPQTDVLSPSASFRPTAQPTTEPTGSKIPLTDTDTEVAGAANDGLNAAGESSPRKDLKLVLIGAAAGLAVLSVILLFIVLKYRRVANDRALRRAKAIRVTEQAGSSDDSFEENYWEESSSIPLGPKNLLSWCGRELLSIATSLELTVF